MVTTSHGSLLARLTQSELLDETTLAACRAAAGDDDDALAAHLLKEQLLTRFQVRQLRAGACNFAVGRYLITDCIGRGGNGIVFKARHRLMQRDVALKTLDTRNLHRAEEALARFQREIEIVSRLEHPNVIRALDVLQTRTHTYLVLEYVPGRDLAAVVKERGPLPVREAVAYALQAARGLAYAHAQGIVHRDLKPENLLLTDAGVVKLSDLGLAKLYEGGQSSGLTMKGLCLGTPEYMAPEQAEDATRVSPRSDLYSLGATLFHLLTAQLPVTGVSYLHRLQHLLTAPPRPLLEARADVPPGLAAVVDRLRERRPEDRPTDAEEVIALLEPFAREPAVDDPEQWPAERKAAQVLEVLSGKAQPTPAAERWLRTFVDAGTRALDPDAADAAEQVKELHATIGAQAMEIERLKRKLKG
jgi:serine/threonine protein kinase